MPSFSIRSLPDNVITVSAITVGGLLLYQLLFFILKKWVKKKERVFPILLREHIYAPGFVLMLMFTLLIGHHFFKAYLKLKFFGVLHHFLIIGTIGSTAWLIIAAITVMREMLLNHYRNAHQNDFSVRKANTKFILIQRVLNFLIVFAAICIILMTFQAVRQIGASLLASAGVLGLVLGFAAQKSLGSLFAGVQIAIAQPIRIGDVVIVQDKFGTIGEITLTYVIINVWDGSRLVVPINYFLEKPFENLTRLTSDIIAKVRIHADYSLPVEPVRKAFKEWMEASPLWDHRSCDLVVIGATESTMELRATMSARDSSDAFKMEVMVREKLIEYIRSHYPESLPRIRIMTEGTPARA